MYSVHNTVECNNDVHKLDTIQFVNVIENNSNKTLEQLK